MSGEIGNFAGVPLFTDCAVIDPFTVQSTQELARLMDERKHLPHTCGDKPCSRRKWWDHA